MYVCSKRLPWQDTGLGSEGGTLERESGALIVRGGGGGGGDPGMTAAAGPVTGAAVMMMDKSPDVIPHFNGARKETEHFR